MPPARLRLALSLVSAAALAYEILLTRLFSIIQWHHFAYMMISVALLGYGAAGTCVTLLHERLVRRLEAAFTICAALFGVSATLCFLGRYARPGIVFHLHVQVAAKLVFEIVVGSEMAETRPKPGQSQVHKIPSFSSTLLPPASGRRG